jgi:hypothetical protein
MQERPCITDKIQLRAVAYPRARDHNALKIHDAIRSVGARTWQERSAPLLFSAGPSTTRGHSRGQAVSAPHSHTAGRMR